MLLVCSFRPPEIPSLGVVGEPFPQQLWEHPWELPFSNSSHSTRRCLAFILSIPLPRVLTRMKVKSTSALPQVRKTHQWNLYSRAPHRIRRKLHNTQTIFLPFSFFTSTLLPSPASSEIIGTTVSSSTCRELSLTYSPCSSHGDLIKTFTSLLCSRLSIGFPSHQEKKKRTKVFTLT